MVGEHLLIFGWVEFLATALVIKYFQKQEPALLQVAAEVKK
jgi:ABC-type Co2+ transport system permease subunit